MKEIDVGLRTLLSTDATLISILGTGPRVHNTFAPDTAPYPMIIFQSLGGPDEYSLTVRIRSMLGYQIRVIDQSYDMSKIHDAVARIDELLMDFEVVAGQTLYLRRSGTIPNYPEISQGKPYIQGGATYRIEMR